MYMTCLSVQLQISFIAALGPFPFAICNHSRLVPAPIIPAFFTYPVSQSARAGFFLRVAMAAPIASPEHCELLDAVQVAVDRMWREQGSQIANPAGFKVCLTVCCVV